MRETGILEIEDDKVRTGPPLAMKFILAGLKPPPENSVYYASSARRFWSEICGKTLTLDIKREAKDVRYCVVKIGKECINDKLLREGVLRVHEGRQMREEPAYVTLKIFSTLINKLKLIGISMHVSFTYTAVTHEKNIWLQSRIFWGS